MDFLSPKIAEYTTAHTEDEPTILSELSKETWQKILNPVMLSEHYQGRVLALLSKLIKPRSILEIGTYTGYSALCLAEGLEPKGMLHTIDVNEELLTIQKRYFKKAGYENKIKQYTGNALDIIPTIKSTFDLAFIDADKTNYSNYFNSIIEKMNTGGIILSDNVLWFGKVVEKVQEKDADTKAIIAYNKLLKEDSRVETVLLPIRDGLTISRVK